MILYFMNRMLIPPLLNFCLFFILFSFNALAQDDQHTAEQLLPAVDFISIRKNIQLQTNLNAVDLDLYMKYVQLKFPEERSDFIKRVSKGEITDLTIESYTEELIKKYLSVYDSFQKQKREFADLQNQNVYVPLSFNGPCENIDFESGTTAGWQGAIGTSCTDPTPCFQVAGFSTTRHQIMNDTMVDPYIPTLPVVAPGGNYSFRLENYRNGGDASLIRQTFLVTPTNNIFTYRYAAVLEDPADDHDDEQRPYFKVRMYDKNGKEIKCATYTAIAKPPIKNFTHSKVLNPNYDPTEPRGGLNNNQFMDLYYRNWTTVTIPLLGYEGQNVTVEFIASDCSKKGHLGYAYVDANCSFLDKKIPPTICGAENVTLYGPADFASYQWSGPGIVGSKTTQNIVVNKSGVYQLKLTPVADNPCPVTIETTVPERCLPVPISTSACETIKGSRIKNGVDLTTYNTAITAYNSLARVFEWHSGLPATAANKITNLTNINIKNGAKYYAVIKYTTAGSDTAELNFIINPTPVLQFADINPVCKSTGTVKITNVSPAGGTFAGEHITAAGVFSLTAAGTFPITYIYTNTQGCKDSTTKSIVVNPPPVLTIGNNQTLCETTKTVDLAATATNQTNIKWSGGAGAFSNSDKLKTTYKPTSAEINSGTLSLTLTITGISPCSAVSDTVVITFIKSPVAHAGLDKDICTPTNAAIQLQGISAHAKTNLWNGGSGTFSSNTTLNATYKPSPSDMNAGSVSLILTSTAHIPCREIQDTVELRFHKSPVANAGPDKTICTGTTILLQTPAIPQTTYSWENISGTQISSTTSASIVARTDSSIVLKLENQFGCTDSDTIKIDAFTPPVFHLGGPFCFADQLILDSRPTFFDALTGKPIWYKDSIMIDGEEEFSISINEEGKYTIYYKQGECEASSNTNVFKNPVLITPDRLTDCEHKVITLTTTDIPSATYTWLKDGHPVGTNSYTINTEVSTGTKKYLVEVIDQHTCKATDSIEITGIPKPIVHLKDTSICKNNVLLLNGTPSNISELADYILTYKWMFNNTELPQNNIPVLEARSEGNYLLTASIKDCADTTSMYLQLNPLPILDLPGIQKICPESDPAILLDAGNHTNYLWQPNGEATKQISAHKGGIYTVTVSNTFMCSAAGSIEVKEICPPRLFVADAFSPNQDGTNDLFKVYGAHIGSYKLLIFNRWGEIIFESLDKDHFWNGIYKNELMPIGVYPWTIIYEGDSHEYVGPYKLEGSVTIVK